MSYLIGFYNSSTGVSSSAVDERRFYTENHWNHGENEQLQVSSHMIKWRYTPRQETLYWINRAIHEVPEEERQSVRTHIEKKGLAVHRECNFAEFMDHVTRITGSP